MQESDPATAFRAAQSGRDRQDVIDRLVFAALREQTRARRWRVFVWLFFIVYLSVVTAMLFARTGDGFGFGESATGEGHTALVKLSGVIAAGEEGGANRVVRGLEAAFEHQDTVAVVLEINSPGGSPVQAADIYDEMLRLRREHPDVPLHAVVTDVAASGGYYVAAAAERIYANRSSLVGSIGVRLDAFGFVDLMDKIGVERRLLTAGEHKGLFDPFLPEQASERAHLQGVLDDVHRHFIDAVKAGRGERLTDDPELFSGLIWSGEQALQLGLIDDFGTTRGLARELGAEQVVDFTPRSGPLERLADRIGVSAGRHISERLMGFELN